MAKNIKNLGQRIRDLRLQNNLSQGKLAALLKIERTSLSQVENGQREVKSQELIKLAQIFNISVDELLGLKRKPAVILEKNKFEIQKTPDIRIDVPQKNLKKFKEVLLYILNKIGAKPNVGETVLYKLLYFIDFDFYEIYEEQLIGATYIKNNYGPTPVEFKKIVDRMIKDKELRKVKDEYFDFPRTKYLPLRPPDLTVLKANELSVIDDVLTRISDMNASQISEYSHHDVPWLTASDQDQISYEAVFYRTDPYTRRTYESDI